MSRPGSTKVIWRGGIPYEIRPLYTMGDGHPAKTLLDLVIGYIDQGVPQMSASHLASKARLVSCHVEPTVSLDPREFDELTVRAEFHMVNPGGWR